MWIRRNTATGILGVLKNPIFLIKIFFFIFSPLISFFVAPASLKPNLMRKSLFNQKIVEKSDSALNKYILQVLSVLNPTIENINQMSFEKWILATLLLRLESETHPFYNIEKEGSRTRTRPVFRPNNSKKFFLIFFYRKQRPKIHKLTKFHEKII